MINGCGPVGWGGLVTSCWLLITGYWFLPISLASLHPTENQPITSNQQPVTSNQPSHTYSLFLSFKEKISFTALNLMEG